MTEIIVDGDQSVQWISADKEGEIGKIISKSETILDYSSLQSLAKVIPFSSVETFLFVRGELSRLQLLYKKIYVFC